MNETRMWIVTERTAMVPGARKVWAVDYHVIASSAREALELAQGVSIPRIEGPSTWLVEEWDDEHSHVIRAGSYMSNPSEDERKAQRERAKARARG